MEKMCIVKLMDGRMSLIPESLIYDFIPEDEIVKGILRAALMTAGDGKYTSEEEIRQAIKERSL